MTEPTPYQTRANAPRQVPRIDWRDAGPELIMNHWSVGEKEHMAIYGPTGSGKSTLEAWLLVQRAVHRHTGEVIICTKKADKTIMHMGYPIARDWSEMRKDQQVIMWANPSAVGTERKQAHNRAILEVLHKLFVPESNNLIAFDEIAYVQSLSPEMKDTIEMYLREARSAQIELLLMKQRPQGVTREVIAETAYTFSFKPKDQDDAARTGEVFGDRRGLTPVLLKLNRQKYEFLAKSEITDSVFISRLPNLDGTRLPADFDTSFKANRERPV